MNQPTKDTLREQLALAADEIIRLRSVCVAADAVLAEVRGVIAEFDKATKRRWWEFWK